MTRWIVAAVCLAILVFIVAVVFFAYRTQEQEKPFEVKRGSLGRSARGQGKVETVTPSVPLGFTIAGRLKSVLAEEGRKVQKGELLAELDLADLEARVAAAEAALKEAQAREKLLLEPPRAVELAGLDEKIAAADRGVEEARLRLKGLENLQVRAVPAWEAEAARLEAKRALFQCNEAVYAQNQVVKTPLEDDLALAEWKWRIAQVDTTDAEEKHKLQQEDGFPASYTGKMKRWEIAAMLQNIERCKRREKLAQAEYDKVKRGAPEEEKMAVTQRAEAAKVAYEMAQAKLKRLENPPPPPKATENEIELAKNAVAQADAAKRVAVAALDLAKAGPRDAEKAVAAAAVERAQKALAEIKAQSQHASLTAPFAGTLVKRYAEPGSPVAPFTPVVELADLTKLCARAEVEAVYSASVRPGQKVILSGSLLPGGPTAGKVGRVVDVAGPKTLFSKDPRETKGGEVLQVLVEFDVARTEKAKASLEALRPGVRLDVKIEFETRDNVLTVPKSYVFTSADKCYVLKADAVSASGRVGATKRLEVELGRQDDLNYEILSGLSEGDVLVRPQGRE
jgi:HlyD family secretion protein